MDGLADKIRANRAKVGKTVKDTSLKVYVNNVNNLKNIMTDGEENANQNWFDDKEKVIKKLNDKDLNFTTVRNYLNAILMYLYVLNDEDDTKGIHDDLIKSYEYERDKLNLQYDEMNASSIWSDNQEKNMISKKELDDVITQIGQEIKDMKLKQTLITNVKQKTLLQTYLVLNIHRTLPIRNELGECLVMRKREFNKVLENEKNTKNFLIIEKNRMYFSFNAYKTAKIYKERVIEIPPHLKKTIRFYLRFFPGEEHLLCKWDGTAIGSNNLSQLLTKQFKKRIGKSVSTTLLRKLYLSDKYLPIKDDMAADANILGHSTATALKVYTKPNPSSE